MRRHNPFMGMSLPQKAAAGNTNAQQRLLAGDPNAAAGVLAHYQSLDPTAKQQFLMGNIGLRPIIQNALGAGEINKYLAGDLGGVNAGPAYTAGWQNAAAPRVNTGSGRMGGLGLGAALTGTTSTGGAPTPGYTSGMFGNQGLPPGVQSLIYGNNPGTGQPMTNPQAMQGILGAMQNAGWGSAAGDMTSPAPTSPSAPATRATWQMGLPQLASMAPRPYGTQ